MFRVRVKISNYWNPIVYSIHQGRKYQYQCLLVALVVLAASIVTGSDIHFCRSTMLQDNLNNDANLRIYIGIAQLLTLRST